jgi:hypothetical protein
LSQMTANQIPSFQRFRPSIPWWLMGQDGRGRESTLVPWLHTGLWRRQTKETGNSNATAISEYCYQTELNMWNRMKQHKLRNGNATLGRLRNSTPRQLSKPVFSQLRCSVVS